LRFRDPSSLLVRLLSLCSCQRPTRGGFAYS
jgi:hypothetical protein